MQTRFITVVVSVVMALILALPLYLHALAVGEMVVQTPLGKPFVAEIPLQLESQERAQGVSVTIGDQKEYRAEKLSRHAVVDTLEALVILGDWDRLRITSKHPIQIAIFDLVLLVRTGNVTIVKAYHVAFAAPPSAALPAPVVEAPRASSSRTRPEKASAPPSVPVTTKKATTPPPGPAWAQNLPPRFGPIQNGVTLYGVVEELGAPRDMLWQAVVALWQANKQEFFGGNMHGLPSGVFLTVPPKLAEDMTAMSRGEAQRIIAEQWETWQTLRRTPGGLQQLALPEKESATVAKNTPLLPSGASPAAVAGTDMHTLLQRMEDLFTQHLAQTETPGGAVTFVSATELQGELQVFEERLLKRVQDSLKPIVGGARDAVFLNRLAFAGEKSSAFEEWLPTNVLVYILVIENVLLLLFGGSFLWRWYRSRT